MRYETMQGCHSFVNEMRKCLHLAYFFPVLWSDPSTQVAKQPLRCEKWLDFDAELEWRQGDVSCSPCHFLNQLGYTKSTLVGIKMLY